MSREKLLLPDKSLARAMCLLRNKLEMTQDDLAHQIGTSKDSYSNWENARSSTPGVYVLRMLALCPDEETRANFFLDIGEVGGKIPVISRPEVPKQQGEGAQPRGMRYEQLSVKIPKARPKGRR
jgi:transcriptional regulator with XRE-family HTH domain